MRSSSHGFPLPTHNFVGSFNSYQSHRNLKARVNMLVLRTPSPPYTSGRLVMFQSILHFAPVVLSDTDHRKALSIFSMFYKDGGLYDKRRDEVDHLGSEHRLDKSRAPNGGDVLALISLYNSHICEKSLALNICLRNQVCCDGFMTSTVSHI